MTTATNQGISEKVKRHETNQGQQPEKAKQRTLATNQELPTKSM
jgi:hypothetical protein